MLESMPRCPECRKKNLNFTNPKGAANSRPPAKPAAVADAQASQADDAAPTSTPSAARPSLVSRLVGRVAVLSVVILIAFGGSYLIAQHEERGRRERKEERENAELLSPTVSDWQTNLSTINLPPEEKIYHTIATELTRDLKAQTNLTLELYRDYTEQDAEPLRQNCIATQASMEAALNRFRAVNVPFRFSTVDALIRQAISDYLASSPHSFRFLETADANEKILAVESLEAFKAKMKSASAELRKYR
jgi:hypothetical protein